VTAAMLARVGTRLVLTDARIRSLLGRTIESARPPLGCRLAAELRSRWHEAAIGDLALIQYSSGTTVAPKPVALTHANLVAQLASLERLLLDARTPRCGVGWLPLYPDMGLIGCLLLAAYVPGTLVLLPPELFVARPALWLRAISRHGAAISPAPNFAYALTCARVRDEELDGVNLSSWQHALDGAEPVSAAVARRFGERFARFGFNPGALRPVYGLSEA